MPRKKDGLLFDVHPTPAIGKDGKNIVYVKPRTRKMSATEMDAFCSRNYGLRYGELSRAFDVFLRAAAEAMSMGYRIDTPIGSFAPRLKLRREITNPDEVKGRDVLFNGVDYNPGKHWDEVLENWNDGFRRTENSNTQDMIGNEAHLEKALQASLRALKGYTTVKHFAYCAHLTYYSASKQLAKWCEGEKPKLLKSRMGQQFIYTEI